MCVRVNTNTRRARGLPAPNFYARKEAAMNAKVPEMIEAFNAWNHAVGSAAENDRHTGFDLWVTADTRRLVNVILGDQDYRDFLREARVAVAESVIAHASALLWGPYFSDSNTDGPCDIEWDVHMLQAVLTPGYQVDDDVFPAYVYGTFFDGPQTYSDGTAINDDFQGEA